ncbi:MAG: N-6 DNA methylase [Candidatus Eisenbacteria bacterium]
MFREEVINVKMAELLCDYGLDAIPETITPHKKLPDVSILVRGTKLILEGRKASQRAQLEKDAKGRIEQGLCDISMAIVYHPELYACTTTEKLADSLRVYSYGGRLFYQTKEGIKQETLAGVDIETLVASINAGVSLLVDSDVLAATVDEVKGKLEQIVEYASAGSFWFDETVIARLKEALGLEEEDETEKFKKDLIRIAMFVLFDGMVFHEMIANCRIKVDSLTLCSESQKLFFDDEWKRILKINYEPIFNLAFCILSALPTGSPETESLLKNLRELALRTVATGILRKHDFMGRIYHKLLLKTTGKYYATNYTAVPSAYLLAYLLYKTPSDSLPLSSMRDLKAMRIIDPACGSGTLLSASYVALRDIYACVLTADELPDFHKTLLQKTIYGWDVLDYATHLTLTVLGLHSTPTLVRKTNMTTLANGADDTGTYLGSLSYLNLHASLKGKTWVKPSKTQSMDKVTQTYKPMNIPPGTFNVVIMNPPFSRSAKPNCKFGYKSEVIKKRMAAELAKILVYSGLDGTGQAGLGAPFIGLADNLLKPGGRLGVVIPRAILSGVSWKKIRDLLHKDYEIRYIISNHDPGDRASGVEPWNWSEDTDLGEVMIIAEKTTKLPADRETVYVNLWNKPRNEVDSILISHQIVSKRPEGLLSEGVFETLKMKRDVEVGTFYRLRQSELADGWLAPCLFANPSLNRFTMELRQMLPTAGIHGLLKTWSSMNKTGPVRCFDGVDIKQVKTAFEQTSVQTEFPILWGQQSAMNRLYLGEDFIGYGRAKSADSARLHEINKSSFILSERPHLHNDALIAFRTARAVLTTAFWELGFRDAEIEPLMLLWFNSTFGLLLYLSASTSSMGEIFKTKKAQMSLMRVIDPGKLKEGASVRSAELFKAINEREFRAFPEEFALAAKGEGLRAEVDKFFSDELELAYDLRPYYEMLANEPALTLKRL